jgi:predicted acylesterase/phospholipase RssA/CRP-like cAMP-binding protein
MLRDIEGKMSWIHLPRGAVLFRQGDPSESFSIIISGRLEVVISNPGGQARQINELAQGDLIGEMGVFTGSPRSATVVASRDSELLEFSKAEFEDLTRSYPQFMQSMMRLLIERLKRANLQKRPSSLSRNILVAPAHDQAPVDEFAQRLLAAIHRDSAEDDAGRNACLLLSSGEVDRRMGIAGVSQATENSPDDLRLRSWLGKQERLHHVILLQADATVTPWTTRCARHADEVIYVANAADSPRAGSVVAAVEHSELADHPPRRRALVLMHAPGTDRPRGTIPWLMALGIVNSATVRCSRTRHFHVRRDRETDFERLARFVNGREVGLVLSGGGARGFAHVGCIRAMQELNIPIDMIGGVSMGSLVSAAYAYDPEGFEGTLRGIKSQLRGALFDFTAPLVAFARGRRFDKRLEGWFGDVRIEDLWVPYFCVSSNLTEASIVVFESGALWWAVRASGTLPGLTSPMVRDGCLLFDGCLLDNLPMDVMRERMGTSRVVAVDVGPPHDLKVSATEIQSPSGWWLLWQKLTPFGTRIELPNIFLIMRRAAELGSVYARENLISQHLADIYLRPPVESIELHDFAQVDEAARIGRDHCHRQLAEWWRSQP